MDRDLRERVEVTRRVLKTTQRSLRTAVQMLADLEEVMDSHSLKEAQRNGQKQSGEPPRAEAELARRA